MGEQVRPPEGKGERADPLAWTRKKGFEKVQEWLLDQTRMSTQNLFSFHLKKFSDWISETGRFETPIALLEDYEKLDIKGQYSHVQLIKAYMNELRAKGYTSASRKSVLTAIKSFYLYNQTPLPKISAQDKRRMFEVSEKQKSRLIENPATIDDLRRTLIQLDEPYKSICLVMFQSGLGLAEFQYFNAHGWEQIDDHLDDKELIQIRLIREKTTSDEVKPYYSFLHPESVDAIKRWLEFRANAKPEVYGGRLGANDKGPIFIVKPRIEGAKCGPPSSGAIRQAFQRAMKRAGIVPLSSKGPYKLHPHEMRDILRTLAAGRVMPEFAEFILGHEIDPNKYNKIWTDVERFREEYTKLIPFISLWSNTSNGRVRVLETETKNLKNRIIMLEDLARELLKSQKEMLVELREAQGVELAEDERKRLREMDNLLMQSADIKEKPEPRK